MKRSAAIFLFTLLPGMLRPAFAFAQQRTVISDSPDSDARQAEIAAATSNGVAKLRDQVLQTRLTRDLTVQDYLDRTQSLDDLDRVLASVQPVGKPRWVDDTCQVQLELPGQKVSMLLTEIARDPAKHSALKAEALRARLGSWNHLKFIGMGCSAGGAAVEQARPIQPVGKWLQVSDVARRKAIAAAQADAERRVTDSLGTIPLGEKTTVATALSHPAIARQVNEWIGHQPVTRVEFRDDLKVSVTVSVSPKNLAAQLRSAVAADAGFSREHPSIDWGGSDRAIEALPGSYCGTADVEAPGTALSNVVLPITPPDWVDQELSAEGTASGNDKQLKVALAAERDAQKHLREQLLQLRLEPGATLGDAADADLQLKDRIDIAIKSAHTERVIYKPDGSVRVKMTLDLRDAWDELRDPR